MQTSLENIWETEDSITYVYKGKVDRIGHLSKIWIFIDFKTEQQTADGRKYFSVINLFEYDCKQLTRKVLSIVMMSERMFQGDIVYKDDNVQDPGLPVPPEGTVGNKVWTIACAIN